VRWPSCQNRGLDLSILDGLRKERGRQSSTSAAASRRRVLRPSKNRLPADRIAAALGTTPVVPPPKAPSPPRNWVPKRTLAAEAQPDTGRHRGPDAPQEHWVAAPTTAEGLPRHALLQGSTIGETLSPASAPRRRRPLSPPRDARVREVPAPVDVSNGRHRRPAPSHRRALSAHRGSLGIQAHFRVIVAVGVVALVIAVAMMFGVRVVVSRSSAQTQLVATTTHQLVPASAAKSVVGAP
jgi:hypothetical protein